MEYRKPTLKDINDVKLLIDGSINTEERLTVILSKLFPESYEPATIVIGNNVYNPTLNVDANDKMHIYIIPTNSRIDKYTRHKHLNELPQIYRRDMICQIWNELKKNTDEIENL